MAQQSTSDTARELWDLLRSYARQETVDPFKALGKSLAWGVAGAVFVGTGIFLLAMAGLRVLQTETDAFEGNLSWLPYLIVGAGLALVVALAAAGIGRTAAARSSREEM